MKDLTLNQLEQTRLHVLNSVLEHQLPVAQAAELLGVSERHAWRILAAYRREGAAALAHGNRGRKPRNTVSDHEANAVIQLASTTYAGPTTLTSPSCSGNGRALTSAARPCTAS